MQAVEGAVAPVNARDLFPPPAARPNLEVVPDNQQGGALVGKCI